MTVSTMCNGEFFDKSPDKAFQFFDTLIENTRNWEVQPLSVNDSRDYPQPRGKFQLSESDDINALIAVLSLTQSLMSQHNENMPPPPGSDHGDQVSFELDTCRPLREYLHPLKQTTPSCIVLPVNHHRFNLKPNTIQLLPTFHWMDYENPYTHMKEFKDVCGTCMD